MVLLVTTNQKYFDNFDEFNYYHGKEIFTD